MASRMSEPLVWRHRTGEIVLDRTRVMGVLNVTPDSFSDGGRFLDPDAAVRRGLEMVEEGADILDIGGESTRPGSEPVPADEEWRRVSPVIQGLAAEAIAVDPGAGFGEDLDHHLALLRHLDTLGAVGRPVVVGVSRKSCLKRLGAGDEARDRLAGSLAAAAFAVAHGAHVIRAHDVLETTRALRVIDAILGPR